MSARRPKPTALKERTSVRPNLGLSRLFASANDLVPVKSDEEDPTLKLDDPRLSQKQPTRSRVPEPEDYGTAVVVPNRTKRSVAREGTVTQPLAPIEPEKIIPQRTSVAKLKTRDAEKFEARLKKFALVLLIPGLAFVAYEALTSQSVSTKPVARQSALRPAEIQERLKYYQTSLGQHLNRERIGVEIENYQKAPALTGADHKVKPPSMLDGVPLQGEANNFQRPKDLPYDPTYSEAKVGYGLQEEQERREFEKRAEKEWVREFIANARKDGVELEIDETGKVTVTKVNERPDDSEAAIPEFTQGGSDGGQ